MELSILSKSKGFKMAASPLSDLQRVRNKTTNDTAAVSDDLINEYLMLYRERKYEVRILLAAADICDYLATLIPYKIVSSETTKLDDVQYSTMADKYRSQASVIGAFFR